MCKISVIMAGRYKVGISLKKKSIYLYLDMKLGYSNIWALIYKS